MVRTSISRGTLSSSSGSSVSSAAHRIGSAAFFAPEMRTSPASGRPPVISSLSTRGSLLRRERPHRQGVDLLAHALAERRVHQLVALHAALSRESRGHHQRLEVLAVADYFHALAGEPRADALLDAVGGHHGQVLSL